MTVRGRSEWQKHIDARLEDHHNRLTEFEKEKAVYEAVAEEQRKYINDRFNRIQDNINATKNNLEISIKKISDGINKVLWAIGLAVVLAMVQFMLSGGLKTL